MTELVPVKCPSCGAALTVRPQDDTVVCAYCQASAFVKRPGGPPSPPSPPGRMAPLYVEVPSRRVSPALVIAAVAVLGVVVVSAGILAAIASSRAQPTRNEDPAERVTRDDEAARLHRALAAAEQKEDALRAALAGARDGGGVRSTETSDDPHRAREAARQQAKAQGVIGPLGK
jgi:hypothetical protein